MTNIINTIKHWFGNPATLWDWLFCGVTIVAFIAFVIYGIQPILEK